MKGKPAPYLAIRAARGLRRVDVASASGVSLETLRKLERGEYGTLRLSTLVKVAVALGVAPAELVPGLAVRPQGKSLTARSSP